MPYDPDLAEKMRSALQSLQGIEERKLFGGYWWMLNGNMLCGVEVGRYVFRVGKEQEAEALNHPGVTPMDITGRPMRGIVWVQAENTQGPALQQWIELATRFVSALPPK
jgi:TfoX/Sxy family transcriptional regulator of competence genes